MIWITAAAVSKRWRAAARKELDVEVIEAELAKLAEQPIEKDWRSAPLAEIIDHIIVRYHDRHREQLPELILQRLKSSAFTPTNRVPKGLTKYLTMLHEELSSHYDERRANPLPNDQTRHGQPCNGANQRNGKRAR